MPTTFNHQTSTTQGSDQEWNYDPNEPRYCICNQVRMKIFKYFKINTI